MRVGQRRVSAVTVLVALVVLLVPALAWLQYQWVGQLSQAESERMQRTLRTAASQFAVDFDSEISRTLVGLQVEASMLRDRNWPAFAERYSAWSDASISPKLVRDLLLVEHMQLRRWNTQTLVFEPLEWPADLLPLRDSLASHATTFDLATLGRGGDRERFRRESNLMLSLGDDTTLVNPITVFEPPADREGPPKITTLGFTVIRLDPQVIRDTLLATLAARHLHSEDGKVDYRVAVVGRADPARIIWESEPGAAAAVATAPDVSQDFMAPRPDRMFMFTRSGSRLPPASASARESSGELRRDLSAPDAPDAPAAPAAPAASASARESSGELRRDPAEAASGREGGPDAPDAVTTAIIPSRSSGSAVTCSFARRADRLSTTPVAVRVVTGDLSSKFPMSSRSPASDDSNVTVKVLPPDVSSTLRNAMVLMFTSVRGGSSPAEPSPLAGGASGAPSDRRFSVCIRAGRSARLSATITSASSIRLDRSAPIAVVTSTVRNDRAAGSPTEMSVSVRPARGQMDTAAPPTVTGVPSADVASLAMVARMRSGSRSIRAATATPATTRTIRTTMPMSSFFMGVSRGCRHSTPGAALTPTAPSPTMRACGYDSRLGGWRGRPWW